MTDPEEYTGSFKSLADETRLKIMLVLNSRSRSVGEIVDLFNLSQPTISRHLLVLKQNGLVVSKRRGQQVIYAINEDGIRALALDFFRNFDCCRGISIPSLGRKR